MLSIYFVSVLFLGDWDTSEIMVLALLNSLHAILVGRGTEISNRYNKLLSSMLEYMLWEKLRGIGGGYHLRVIRIGLLSQDLKKVMTLGAMLKIDNKDRIRETS